MPVKKSTEGALVTALKHGEIKLRLIGATPFYYNSMSIKAKRDLLIGGTPKTTAEKREIKHNPEEEFRDSVYKKSHGNTHLYFPPAAIKQAMSTAAIETKGVARRSGGRSMKTRYEEIEEAAIQFHKENPKVWEYFVKFTSEVIGRGFNNYSAKGVFERIRWETDQADDEGRSTFKINNNFSALYARWFMDIYPEHLGFFRLRSQPSELQLARNLPELGPEDFD